MLTRCLRYSWALCERPTVQSPCHLVFRCSDKVPHPPLSALELVRRATDNDGCSHCRPGLEGHRWFRSVLEMRAGNSPVCRSSGGAPSADRSGSKFRLQPWRNAK